MLSAQECAVHWVDVGAPLADDLPVLTPLERARAQAMRHPPTRARFVAAAALLRRVVAAETGRAPEQVIVDRSCASCGEPHGRPRLPGQDLHASITHSGWLAGVALTRVGPVGLDAEAVGERDVGQVARSVLDPAEPLGDDESFYRYWTRKEALVKATGDGLGVGLREVVVTPADRPPAVLRYPGRPGLYARMADLSPGPGIVAGVAVLTRRPITLTERRHRWEGGGTRQAG